MLQERIYRIVCAYDSEAEVWYVADSDVPGLSLEAPTREELTQRIKSAAVELLELNAHLDRQQIERAPIDLLWANQAERVSLA